MQRVVIHSVPRSGSTWLGEIINSSEHVKYCFQPLFSYAYKDFLSPSSSKQEVNDFFSELSTTNDDFICQKVQRLSGALPSPAKNKNPSHVVYKEVRYHHILNNLMMNDQSLKSIFLIRDPVSTLTSWINAPKEFNANWNIAQEILSGAKKNEGRVENFYGYNAWERCALLFKSLAKQWPDRVRVVKYSQLVSFPYEVTEGLFDFCGLNYAASTREFIRESRTMQVSDEYSVFRGVRAEKAIKIPSDIKQKIYEKAILAGLGDYISKGEEG